MNKIGLIIAREYLSRVRKKSFIIMTILAPVLFGGFFFFIGWTATKGIDTKSILVIDESSLFVQVLQNTDEATFTYEKKPLETGKKQVISGEYDVMLYIPRMNLDTPRGVTIYASTNPSLGILTSMSRKIEGEIENIKLKRSGIDQQVLESLKVDLDIDTINLSGSGDEKASSSIGATVVGYIAAFLIYMFIFIYGTQCMRGVVEEKTSRIIEVIISSVKPFQLMMGKVIGIAGVGLTQFILWVILTTSISTVAGGLFMNAPTNQTNAGMEQVMNTQEDSASGKENSELLGVISTAVDSINMKLVIVSFLFYFFAGYLLYGALFAAIGSAVDSDADAQQFMFPVTLPLIVAIVTLSAVLNDPNGSLAFWMSMIPFTSPVVMMMRVPFGVPMWELVLSMLLMIGGFIFTIWVGSRIYRIGILMHGTKVNYRVLAKWFMAKN